MTGTLHLIVQRQDGHQLDDCAELVGPADRVVLLGPAAPSALRLGAGDLLPEGVWHVLADDLRQYGIDPDRLARGVAAIEIEQLLELSIQCPRSLSW